ncbi:protein rapunzel-like [Pungitius pungitius]|uniref:protein rapunzel-like n=1 Tax=Pungitius pungitius TaxID=134920 RepID=UPI001888BECB|nr:protein rapunzel-like [Pungitius pungitius]
MADVENIKKTAVKVLWCVEKVSSFASSINPIFGIVSSLVGGFRNVLTEQEGHALDKEFKSLHSQLETVSKLNRQCLKQIHINEVIETYGKYEESIKHQYDAFNNMVAKVKKHPDNTQHHMTAFRETYEELGAKMNLEVYHRGVMGIELLFGKPLLKVYLDDCDKNRKIMERHCLHITHLFHMGLIALWAYTDVKGLDKNMERETWVLRVKEIQEKMLEVLSQCEDTSS